MSHEVNMSAYQIQICSDVEYEELIAEVYIGGKFVAIVSHEHPADGYFVEFPGADQNEATTLRKMEISILLAALAEARAKLNAGT